MTDTVTVTADSTDRRAHDDLMELLDLQQSTDMISKAELVEFVRAHGGKLSDRTLHFYTTAGLIPKSIRVGARAGVYPAVVRELVLWLVRSRERRLSIEAIRELLPLWRQLMRGRTRTSIDLSEVELVARTTVKTMEANYAVPWLFAETLGVLCPTCRGDVEWTLKDGSTVRQGERDDFKLSFVLGEVDSSHDFARPVAWTQLVLPGMGHGDVLDPRTIILGVPMGMRICCDSVPVHVESKRPSATKDATLQREEITANS